MKRRILPDDDQPAVSSKPRKTKLKVKKPILKRIKKKLFEKTRKNYTKNLTSEQRAKIEYIDGGDGFIKWAEDFVCLPVYHEDAPIAVWTPIKDLPNEYKPMWEEQKAVFREALQMHRGRFKYRLIVFCWPRGEGKSYMACLVQLWKFFNFPQQQIKLGANSRDQIKFVHFDVMAKIIQNSSKLIKIVGTRNIQQKEIRLLDKRGNVASAVTAMSTSTGIVSNITGYTFSEMFDMKNNKFFVQLDGSIRNMPNALGVIDSTVSTKQHQLFKLYLAYIKREDPTLFFHYRKSEGGDPVDYWNPNMTSVQLNSYKAKFPLGDFERYFLNLWSAGSEKVFTETIVRSMYYLGVDGKLNSQNELLDTLAQIIKYEEYIKELDTKMGEGTGNAEGMFAQMNRLWPIESIYSITDSYGNPSMATVESLRALGDLFDTDWAILAGVDRADPMKKSRSPAKTIVTIIAKGLPNSRSGYVDFSEGTVPQYIYFMLHMVSIENHDLDTIKDVLSAAHIEYNGIDSLCSERWGMWDIKSWCDEEEIAFEPIYPTYDKQKAIFSEFYTVWKEGRFKAPIVGIRGQKGDYLLEEEAQIFDHDISKKWFGSPEKDEAHGIQDDSMYATGLCIYGGRSLSADDFLPRHGSHFFGTLVHDPTLMGNYK